ncbi:MAG: hypothetical protein NC131_09075 [Roseburia sp.]|nr:hypothetical protein [Roseburia sp.]
MGLFKWLVGAAAVKSLCASSRTQPATVQLHIDVSPDPDDGPPPAFGSGEEDWTRPPRYDEKGREIDDDGFPICEQERLYRQYRRMEAAQRKA